MKYDSPDIRSIFTQMILLEKLHLFIMNNLLVCHKES